MPIKRCAPSGSPCQYYIAFQKMCNPKEKTEDGCCSYNPNSSEMDPYTYIILSQLWLKTNLNQFKGRLLLFSKFEWLKIFIPSLTKQIVNIDLLIVPLIHYWSMNQIAPRMNEMLKWHNFWSSKNLPISSLLLPKPWRVRASVGCAVCTWHHPT